ncbi:hypothetical protein E0U70_11805 [Salmonella enterica subsp. enterica serovar Gloucester]|nr:hypothetical protein [Salmonella enterica subsp. enterica serovar Gloucester]ECO4189692.1 hypothetical protein [Salmonella enterica]
MKRILLTVLMAFTLNAQAAINHCDVSKATQRYDANGDEKGSPIVQETIKKGATLDFKGTSVDVTIPWNAQEKKDPDLFTRELDTKIEDGSWTSEDSRLLKKYNNGFLFIDGPGIHRSVYLISNCK